MTGVLQIHFFCFTLPLAEKASSVIVSLASWAKLAAPSVLFRVVGDLCVVLVDVMHK